MIAWLADHTPFPPLERALREPNGLLAASADLTPERIVAAYARGIFPWYSDEQPVLWWSPDPRMVLYTDEFVVSRSLRRRVRQREFEIRVDTSFREVIRRCATMPRHGQGGTWITAAMTDAYCELHHRGYAHCVEAWHDGVLVGGLYGLAIGRVFFGESMFAERTDASKVALAALVANLKASGVPLIDCQQETAHLRSLGARPIARRAFAAELAELIDFQRSPGAWPSFEAENPS